VFAILSSNVVIAAPVLEIKIALGNSTYSVSDTVDINVNITLDGNPAANVAAVEVVSPYGNPYAIRTIATGNVSQMYSRVQFVDLYTCAQDGTPKTLFSRGTTAYINATITNIDVVDHVALVGIHVQGSDNTPLYAYFPTNKSIMAGHTDTFLLSFQISTAAPSGQARLFGSLFTDYPTNRGFAYCPEQAANFSIVASTPLMPPEPQYGGMIFNMPKKDVKLGNYTVYSVANFNVIQTATDTEAFAVVLIGDVNNDYVVNMRDIAIDISLFQTTPSSPNWNPAADINEDDVVNMRDIAMLVFYFGNTAIP
jgi:hypothetical protein